MLKATSYDEITETWLFVRDDESFLTIKDNDIKGYPITLNDSYTFMQKGRIYWATPVN